jgi:hypothetical protein
MSKQFDRFEKAKLIREGKLDDELPDYEELTGWLQRVPVTWLPSLLSACVHQCVVQGVFREGGLAQFVKSAEERSADPTSILRKSEVSP